jgi:MYXO-CTERM domain-containing protein
MMYPRFEIRVVVLLANVSLCGVAGAQTTKGFEDYLKPTPITCSPLSSATWGVAGVLPRDTCNGIESTNGAGVAPTYLYWDGQIIAGKDGTFHMFMSTWADSAGFNPGWTNSESYHATSSSVRGPYTRQGYIWSSGSHHGHNTSAVELNDGTYAVVVSEVVPFTIYTSSSLDGPWTACPNASGELIQTNGLSNCGDSHLDSNVSLFPRNDGKFEIVQRHGIIAIANTVCGPYIVQKPTWTYPAANTPTCDTSVYPKRTSIPGVSNPTFTWEEDPHIWLSGGVYHIIYSGSGDRVGWHVYSSDGITNWKDGGYAWSPRDYQKIFCYEGSTTCNQWYKMERPGVVLENGHPTHITWAVADVDKDTSIPGGSNHGSKVLVVPFDGVTFDNDFGVGGSGGAAGTGGASSTGGSSTAGGSKATGGSSTAGGSKTTGGTSGVLATGGTSSNGGSKATGGLAAAGGSQATGGIAPNGGSKATGGATGASNVGGTGTIAAATGGRATTGGVANVPTGGATVVSNTTGGTSSQSGGNGAGGQSGGALAVGGMQATGGFIGATGSTTSTIDTNPPTNTGDTSNSGGCGCRVAGGPSYPKSLAIIGVLGVLLLRSRRRQPNS